MENARLIKTQQKILFAVSYAHEYHNDTKVYNGGCSTVGIKKNKQKDTKTDLQINK